MSSTCFSEWGIFRHLAVFYGVSQGSCLGPYFSQFVPVNCSKLLRHIFLKLMLTLMVPKYTYRPDRTVVCVKWMHWMQWNNILKIRTCMVIDKMKMNDGKSEFMIVRTHQQLTNATLDKFNWKFWYNSVSEARNLGVWFDSNLNFNVHITKTCNLAFYFHHNIRRIRKHLSKESAQKLPLALVIRHSDYCNSLLYGLTANKIKLAN